MDTSLARPFSLALQPYVDRGTMAGAVALVGNKAGIIALEAVGFADLATRRPMKTDAMFWIASMTKPMTATAFMMLVDEGKASFDDPVEKYIEGFRDMMVAPAEGETAPMKCTHPLLIRELLSHTSGLDFTVSEDDPPYDQLSLTERVQFYARHLLLHQPGTLYRYSNAGINTVGRIIEIISGMSYEEFMDERLFHPLGMRDTTFWPNKEQIARLATSYKADETKTELVPVPIAQLRTPLDNPRRTPIPAGGLFSTCADVVKFMQLMATGGPHDGRQLVSARAIRHMAHKEIDVGDDDAYGLGWRLQGGRLGHDGAHKTRMYLSRQTGVFSVFLAQQTGEWPNDGDKHVISTFEQVAARLGHPLSACAAASRAGAAETPWR